MFEHHIMTGIFIYKSNYATLEVFFPFFKKLEVQSPYRILFRIKDYLQVTATKKWKKN